MKKQSWDTAAARPMYDAGKSERSPDVGKSPAELSVRLDDGKFECLLKAPSLEGLRRIYKFAGLLLEKMVEAGGGSGDD